ncbi:MAG: hypothetical protein PHN84_10945 [Desulfuromonadaceae bacterium]|nr:hypothetical protein [Desulfuromonadaceae bacterium]MDD2856091.1 hypothetical protein [Desulfuromonadaceae bacterium]
MHSDRIPETEADKIAFQQILESNHSVFSIQSIVIPFGTYGKLTSTELLTMYLEYIRQSTLGLIQPEKSSDGIIFRLNWTDAAVIKFSPELFAEDGNSQKTTLCISGGVLVQPKECYRGQLDFIVESATGGIRATLKLSDYCPLILGSSQPSAWRRWLYRLTQAYLHKIVTIRFLAMVYRKTTGKRLTKNIVRISVRRGKNT